MGCVSHKFFPEPPWECKQLRDAGGHPEYIIPVSNKPQLATLEHLGEKRKAQWATFNFNTLKGIALEISSIKNANWKQFTLSSGVTSISCFKLLSL